MFTSCRDASRRVARCPAMSIPTCRPSPPIKSLDFRGFDSSKLLNQGWEFSCPLNFIGSLPESLTQGLLIGKLLIGGLGVGISRSRSRYPRGYASALRVDSQPRLQSFMYIT